MPQKAEYYLLLHSDRLNKPQMKSVLLYRKCVSTKTTLKCSLVAELPFFIGGITGAWLELCVLSELKRGR